MTISDALKMATNQLKKSKSTSPELDAEVLLAYTLNTTKEDIFIHIDKKVSATHTNKYFDLIQKRINNWPVPYLTKSREFYGLNFYVDKNVLIPRPWTEALVVTAVSALNDQKELKILDIGTGSGAIIISLAHALGKKNKYYASDISTKALSVAKKNAKRYKSKITFKRSDLLKSWKQEFDVVTANLPYLVRETNSSTKHEPKLALISAQKGLKHYRELFQQLSLWKRHPQHVFLEANPNQKKQLIAWARKFLPHTILSVTTDSSAIAK